VYAQEGVDVMPTDKDYWQI